MAPAAELPASREAAAAEGLVEVAIDRAQSFRLTDGASNVTLASGMALNAEGRSVCFLSVERPGAAAALTLTIGVGDHDATECRGVAAVGLVLPAERLVVIYLGASPNALSREPVAFALTADGDAAIDVEASRRLSLAGATTLAGARKALGR